MDDEYNGNEYDELGKCCELICSVLKHLGLDIQRRSQTDRLGDRMDRIRRINDIRTRRGSAPGVGDIRYHGSHYPD
jgi:hypothetical protein